MNRDRAYKCLLQLFAIAAAVVVASCSPTNKIIKSGDPDLIFSHALDLYEQEEWKKAGDIMEAVKPYYTGTLREDSVSFITARCRFKSNDFEGAVPLLDEYRRTFGRSIFLEDAEGMYALSHYYMSPSVQRDQSLTQTAIIIIDEFISRHPESKQVETFKEIKDELMGRLYEKSYLNAYTYYKIGRYKSSIVAFKNALKEYPDSFLREKIMYYTLLSAYELASNSILEKKEDRFLATLDSYYSFISEYPESEYRAEADRMEAKTRQYIEKQTELREQGEDADSEYDAEKDREQRLLGEEETVERPKKDKREKLSKAEKREKEQVSKSLDVEERERKAKQAAQKAERKNEQKK